MLTRRRQIAAELESVEGTAESLTASSAAVLVYDPKFKRTVSKNERKPARRSISAMSSIPGIRSLEMTFGVNMMGSGSETSQPKWADFLRACGFRKRIMQKLTMGSLTGGDSTWVRGDEVTGNTSSASGTVVYPRSTSGGEGVWVVLDDDSPPFQAEVVTDGTTSGTCSAVASRGARYTPDSEWTYTATIGSVSGAVAVGEIGTGGTSGAKIRVFKALTVSSTEIEYEAISGTIQNAETVTFESTETGVIGSAPAQSRMPSVTMGLYDDGRLIKMTGSRGSVSISAKVGEPVRLEFTFQGVDNQDTDEALFSGVSYPSNQEPVLLNVGAELDGASVAVDFESVSVDMSNTVSQRPTPNNASGIKAFTITDRAPNGSFDPESVLPDAYDWYTKWTSGSTFKLEFMIGTTPGNLLLIEMPTLQTSDHSDEEREMHTVDNISFDLVSSISGDDEIVIDII
jgi:hypothetical protein